MGLKVKSDSLKNYINWFQTKFPIRIWLVYVNLAKVMVCEVVFSQFMLCFSPSALLWSCDSHSGIHTHCKIRKKNVKLKRTSKAFTVSGLLDEQECVGLTSVACSFNFPGLISSEQSRRKWSGEECITL